MTDKSAYETMSDEEVIKEAIAWVEDPNDDMSQGLFTRLIALARIGAAVKPRPIEDVPKDEMFFFMIPKPNDKWAVGLTYPTVSKTNNDVYPSYHDGEATYGIPLSALPKPQEPT